MKDQIKPSRVGRWIRRLMWYSVLVLLVMVITAALMAWQATRAPDWYHPNTMTAQQRADAARQAEQVWARTQNWVAESDAAVRREVVQHPEQSADIAPNEQPFEIELTDTQINAAMEKWANVYDAQGKMNNYITHMAVVLQEDRVILAGEVRYSGPLQGRIVSMHLQPQIDPQGQLDMNLQSLKVGRLPLAQAIWQEQSDRAINSIYNRLNGLQQKIKLQPTGDVNGDAVAASLGVLTVRMLTHELTDPVIFIQLADGRRVPVQIRKIQVVKTETGGLLRLTVTAMSQKQREAYIDRLKTVGRPQVADVSQSPVSAAAQ